MTDEILKDSMKVGDMTYTYLDMLDAWISGKKKEQQYKSGDGDTPDFITWLKQHVNDKNYVSK